MAINISVQYNGGLLPDVILLTQGWEPVLILCRDSFFTVYKTVYYYYHVGCCTTLFLFCFYFLSGVPAWRLCTV